MVFLPTVSFDGTWRYTYVMNSYTRYNGKATLVFLIFDLIV